jgi:methylated-DNA-[protein]-cysteine S-methyltransferase
MRDSIPAPRRARTVVDSPIGPLALVAIDGALAGLYWPPHGGSPEPPASGPPVPSSWLTPNPEPGTRNSEPSEAAAVLAAATAQLREYFAGGRTAFDLPLSFTGTPFQRRVWTALCEIPYGETVTYGQLAARIGHPTAARAVGLANGHNPIAIIVPCHRVVGATGDLTGYGGGLERKRFLLALERGGVSRGREVRLLQDARRRRG